MLKISLALVAIFLPTLSLANVTLEVSTKTIPLENYIKQEKEVENRLESIDVYKLAKSAYLLRIGHMLSKELYAKFQSPKDYQDLKPLIASLSKSFKVDAALIAAIVMTESSFNTKAQSPKGAQGLMQLMPQTYLDLGVKDPLDPKENLSAGITYFKTQLERFKNLDLALAAYNAGPYNVKKYQGIPPFKETQNFIVKVKQYYQHYKKEQDKWN